jgi:hypothetical protein
MLVKNNEDLTLFLCIKEPIRSEKSCRLVEIRKIHKKITPTTQRNQA